MSEYSTADKTGIPTGEVEKKGKEDDYIFRFKLEPGNGTVNPNTLLFEFYKDQIQDLLKIIFFSKNGERIIPTEFGFLNDPSKKYPLWPKDL